MKKIALAVLFFIFCVFLTHSYAEDITVWSYACWAPPECPSGIHTGSANLNLPYNYSKVTLTQGYFDDSHPGILKVNGTEVFNQDNGQCSGTWYSINMDVTNLVLPGSNSIWGSCNNSCGASTAAGGTFHIDYFGPDQDPDGPPPCNSSVGNPINVMNGSKYQEETDFDFSFPESNFKFSRYYNSILGDTVNDGTSNKSGPFGNYKWSHNFDIFIINPTSAKVNVRFYNGEFLYFSKSGSTYTPISNAGYSLAKDATGFDLTSKNGIKYRFDLSGQLQNITDEKGNKTTISINGNITTITDPFGRTTQIYYVNNRIDHIVDPSGKTYSYGYVQASDGAWNLHTVTYPDNKYIIYDYSNPTFPHKLTSRTDENGNTKTWGYDSNGRANSMVIAGGLESLTLDYSTPNQAKVTTRNEKIYTYFKNTATGKNLITSSDGCSSCGTANSYIYWGGTNNIAHAFDKNNNRTQYDSYDLKGNPGLVIEAADSVAPRKKNYTYHPVTSAPTSILQKSAISYQNYSTFFRRDFSYDTNNRLKKAYSKGCTRGIDYVQGSAPLLFNYSTSYTYNLRGQVKVVSDPRGHRTTFAYYSSFWDAQTSPDPDHGRLKSTTNHLGYVTTFGNYSSGKPGWTRDVNGILTKNVYDARGRLVAVTAHTRTTRYGYDAFGNRTSMTLPRGNRVSYKYDGANRLTKVKDGIGNYISYSYDTEGNRTREEIKDASGNLKKYQDMSYDSDNRLWKVTKPDTSYTETLYDGNGNQKSVRDANGKTITYAYDALNRLMRTVQPAPKIGFSNISTSYTYDINDNVTSIKDGNRNTTGYVYDDMGKLVETNSPDTGLTRYEYDAAGNLIKKKDAKGTVVNYTYDELNRLTAINFPDSSQDITYAYDSPSVSYGIGRLTGMSDPSGATVYHYDEYGSVVREEKTVFGLAGTFVTLYSYDANGNLESVTYPDGRVVNYTYDDADGVMQASTTKAGTAKDLASNITHTPFGGMSAFTYGNGLDALKVYDQMYRLTHLESGAFMKRDYLYDFNGNITGINDLVNSGKNHTYGYDYLNRLLSDTWSSGYFKYDYDPVGNRTYYEEQISGRIYLHYPYSVKYYYQTGTNKIDHTETPDELGNYHTAITYVHDENGNIESGGILTYGYNLNNRLIQAAQGSTVKGQYVYDGLGRRIKKIAGGKTTYYLYDLTGKLIAEYNGSGVWQSSRAYLENEPLALFSANSGPSKKISASPYSTQICLKWEAVSNAAFYIVCWGDVSGNYPNCSSSLTATAYCKTGLTAGTTWYFIVKAYNSSGALMGQSDETSASLVSPNPSLPHYNYNASIGGQASCNICHIPPGTFLSGFGVRTSASLCYSCHSQAGVGHDKPYGGNFKHPVFVNVTADSGHKRPSFGFVNGTTSDKLFTHLYKGKQVVCMTCHNSKHKPGDPGRSWEYTTTTDYIKYTLQHGGWWYYDYVKPAVYRDSSLWTGPTNLRDRKKYLVPESEYDLDPANGAVIFQQAQPTTVYIYVTLGNDYLRNTNLCLDCHVTATHKQNGCTVCHQTHNTGNLYNVREKVLTPYGAKKDVDYKNVSGLSGSKGACVVCHTLTFYHNTSVNTPAHYDNQNCVTCHPHRQGFPTYTTVLKDFVGKLLAFIGFNNAYADEPPPLENYSMGGGSAPEGGFESFAVEATVTMETSQASQSVQTVSGDGITYYHNDHLGTPQFMSDESGNVVWSIELDPYGNVLSTTGLMVENLRLPGQYYDAETGKYYNYHRDYDPTLGRYLEADPIGLGDGPNEYSYTDSVGKPSAPQTNLYQYSGNNPVNFIDPLGLMTVGPHFDSGPGGSSSGNNSACGSCNCTVACGSVPFSVFASCYKIEECKGNTTRTWLGFIAIPNRNFGFLGSYTCEEFFRMTNPGGGWL